MAGILHIIHANYIHAIDSFITSIFCSLLLLLVTSLGVEYISEPLSTVYSLVGRAVQFSCSTNNVAVIPIINVADTPVTVSNEIIEGVGRRTTISFTALVTHNNISIVCKAGGVVDDQKVFESSETHLLVQGMLSIFI